MPATVQAIVAVQYLTGRFTQVGTFNYLVVQLQCFGHIFVITSLLPYHRIVITQVTGHSVFVYR